MQAQASGQAGGGGGLQGALQNPKVQIGVIAVGAIAIIIVIYFLFFSDTAQPAPAPAAPEGGLSAASPGNTPGSPPGGAAAGQPKMAPMGGAPATAAAPGAPGAPGQAGAAAADKDTVKGPGVKTRLNPFKETKEVKAVEDSIRIYEPPPSIAPPQSIYIDELHKPKPNTKVATDAAQEGEPPIPAMRLAGVVYGEKVSATLQIGEAFVQAVPGSMVPPTNPLYHVDRIEQEKVYLSRRWELAGHKGVQHIEVTLAGAPPRAGGFTPGIPGVGGNGPGGNGPGGNGPGFFQ